VDEHRRGAEMQIERLSYPESQKLMKSAGQSAAWATQTEGAME